MFYQDNILDSNIVCVCTVSCWFVGRWHWDWDTNFMTQTPTGQFGRSTGYQHHERIEGVNTIFQMICYKLERYVPTI